MQNKTGRTGLGDIDLAFAVMAGTLLIGVILGTLAYCFMSDSTADLLSLAAKDHISFRKSADFGRVLLDSFCVSSLFIAAEFLLGFFALGQLPAFALLIYRGMGLGAVLSQSYSETPSHRIVFVILLIVPACVISCYALCVAAKEAVRFSTRLLRLILLNKACPGLLDRSKNYAARFAALEAVAAVSAAVDCIASLIFAGKL